MDCKRCGGDVEKQEQPAGSGYGWTHVGGTRFCSGSKLSLAQCDEGD